MITSKPFSISFSESKFSGLWTRSSDGAKFECILTSKNKLKFGCLQKTDENNVDRVTENLFSFHSSKKTITDEGKSHIKGIYNHKGFITWHENDNQIIWIKGEKK